MTPIYITQVGTGASPWKMPNFHLTPFELNVVTEVTGTVGYNIETTLAQYWTVPPAAVINVGTVVSDSAVAAQTTIDMPVTGWRINVISGTGTVTAQGLQAGISNY